MKKLKLDLANLQIQSFNTTPEAEELRRRVILAQSGQFPNDTTAETCAGGSGSMPTCDESQAITCGSGCGTQPTSNYTCDVTCTCGACDPTMYAGCTGFPGCS